MDIKKFKEKIKIGFRNLRKNGYLARQNFMCCQGCGWAKLEEDYGEERTKKAVFYHRQDKEELDNGEPFFVCWVGDGHEIVKVLNDSGVTTDWDGDEGRRILLTGYVEDENGQDKKDS